MRNPRSSQVWRLRKWQEEAREIYRRHTEPNFLLVASPGAGKTLFALQAARDLIQARVVRRMVVVCPSAYLKTQWAKAAFAMGLDLNPEWGNRAGELALDYDGACVTYSQVQKDPTPHREACRVPTLVVLDEVHHAGEGREWGDKIRSAFDPSSRRLTLSGTPFRSDASPMPYVKYGDDRRSLADFTVSYSDALAEGVCRVVLFPTYEGRMVWYNGAERHEACFRDEISEQLSAQRLKTALSPGGNWLPEVIGEAHERLTSLRQEHPDAGGLIVTMDKIHADQVCAVVERVTGEKPVVVTSEDEDASAKIEEFRVGSQPWIVAIKMISEGVDIPRLRVGVYATNTLTELYFRQFVGRVIRSLPDAAYQRAYVYLPQDETLVSYAKGVSEERDHYLGGLQVPGEDSMDGSGDPSGESPGSPSSSAYQPVSSAATSLSVVSEGQVYSPEEIRAAGENALKAGFPPGIDPVMLLKFVALQATSGVPASPGKLAGSRGVDLPEVVAPPTVILEESARKFTLSTLPPSRRSDPASEEKIRHEQKKELREEIRVLLGRFVKIQTASFPPDLPKELRASREKELYRMVNAEMWRNQGCAQEQATLVQLKDRKVFLENKLRHEEVSPRRNSARF